MLKVCEPPSRYWDAARLKVIAPFAPAGPAVLLNCAVAAYARSPRFASVDSWARPGTSARARWSAALLNLYAPAGHWQALSSTLPCTDVDVATHDEHDLTIRATRMAI